ncbi:hypothetical protein KCU78_g4028, partial [Aureobasidium melanogenum]
MRIHLSNICVALMAMASTAYSQNEDCYSDQDDFQPGDLGGISKLPHEIQRCIKLSVWPLAWTEYSQQLDLFCDHTTGTWHQTIPSCLKTHCPSNPTTAISLYNTFNKVLCRGWEGPSLPLTTILSTDGAAFTTSTIYPTTSETRYVMPEFTPRHSTSTSHACLNGHDICGRYHPTSLFTLRTKSKKWTKSRHRLLASTTPWGEQTRPASTVARPTN